MNKEIYYRKQQATSSVVMPASGIEKKIKWARCYKMRDFLRNGLLLEIGERIQAKKIEFKEHFKFERNEFVNELFSTENNSYTYYISFCLSSWNLLLLFAKVAN